MDDYHKIKAILTNIFPNANHEHLIGQLQARLGVKAKQVIIEFPYRDFDFSSVYSIFYSKKHQAVSKDCIRLHFFSDDEIEQNSYIGNIVVRDSAHDSRGRVLLSPNFISDTNQCYIVKVESKSHLMGELFITNTFPSMSQDTDIAVCAHVAVWSINTFFANKYPNYKINISRYKFIAD